MKRSHKNNKARTTARERAHVVFGPGGCNVIGGQMIHCWECDNATSLMQAHARAELARARRRWASKGALVQNGGAR